MAVQKVLSFGKMAGSEATHAVIEFVGKEYKETACDPGSQVVATAEGAKDKITCQKCLTALRTNDAWQKLANVEELMNTGAVTFKEVVEKPKPKAKAATTTGTGKRVSIFGYKVRIGSMSDAIDQAIVAVTSQGRMPTVADIQAAVPEAKEAYIKAYLKWNVDNKVYDPVYPNGLAAQPVATTKATPPVPAKTETKAEAGQSAPAAPPA